MIALLLMRKDVCVRYLRFLAAWTRNLNDLAIGLGAHLDFISYSLKNRAGLIFRGEKSLVV